MKALLRDCRIQCPAGAPALGIWVTPSCPLNLAAKMKCDCDPVAAVTSLVFCFLLENVSCKFLIYIIMCSNVKVNYSFKIVDIF